MSELGRRFHFRIWPDQSDVFHLKFSGANVTAAKKSNADSDARPNPDAVRFPGHRRAAIYATHPVLAGRAGMLRFHPAPWLLR